MIIHRYLRQKPAIPKSVFLATGAIIVGDVVMGEDCSVWFNAVIRGDVNTIRIGSRTNIQDGAIIHCTLDKYATVIGDDVSIGHGAIVHGCTVHDHVLIGMGAKILDRAVIHPYAMIAAGAVVREGFEVPERTLMAGVPAKPVRSLTDDEIAMIDRIPQNYIRYAADYRTLNVLDSAVVFSSSQTSNV
ncbi:gamma carbonic anhydrase family protein [bacterium]|nr:gamma carbonic anhydrase family protein [bacterium]NUN44690.1 gamma carbonic anhydrase family protein [bacterium]HMV27518.1 gamma carbonic anhydrase family protein [bacterium]HMW34219.1 gamma carbonic anhydrase family protein [bacterium]HMW34761.1 gamma carbonic anhydrase family protein [bacterium]